MTKHKPLLAVLTLVAALVCTPDTAPRAEELAVPVGAQADRSQADYPRAGMTQSAVRSKWGEPLSTDAPVGNPPISRWHYPSFTVYFEHDRVVHTVLERRQ